MLARPWSWNNLFTVSLPLLHNIKASCQDKLIMKMYYFWRYNFKCTLKFYYNLFALKKIKKDLHYAIYTFYPSSAWKKIHKGGLQIQNIRDFGEIRIKINSCNQISFLYCLLLLLKYIRNRAIVYEFNLDYLGGKWSVFKLKNMVKGKCYSNYYSLESGFSLI